MTETEQGLYAKALEAFRTKFMPAHRGVSFDRKAVYDFLGIKNLPQFTAHKKAIGDMLYNLSKINKVPELEQTSKSSYRIIEGEINEIVWWEDKERRVLDIRWPYGVEDTSEFGFEDSIVIYPGDVIGLAGEGNKGKTCLALNFLLNNMDKFPDNVYFTSEFNDAKFRERIKEFEWVNIYNESGRPKFRLAKHEENFQDVIIPTALNIIDWVDLPDEPWKIGQIFKKASNKLTTGLCFICMQKRSYKPFAVGGEAAMDYASAFFTIVYDKSIPSNVLKVEKVKESGVFNPAYKKFSFGIEKGGAKIFGIQEVKT